MAHDTAREFDILDQVVLLNTKSGLNCDESEVELHTSETNLAIALADTKVKDLEAFLVEASFCDAGHKDLAPRYYLLADGAAESDFRSVTDMLEAADSKNLIDVATDPAGHNLIFICNGQGYTMTTESNGVYRNVQEVFVLHQLDDVSAWRLTTEEENPALYVEHPGRRSEDFRNPKMLQKSTGLIADVREGIAAIACEKDRVELSYYVQRFEPYYGSGLDPLRYKGSSLNEAIRCFKELPQAFCGDRHDALNVLGVEYRVHAGGAVTVGACDLIQERCDRPLFLSQDYKVMQAGAIPEVAEGAVEALKEAFNLNAFGQLVNQKMEIDGAEWVIRHFHEQDLVLAECYEAGLNVYRQGGVMMSTRAGDKDYVIQDSRTGETIDSFDTLAAAFDAARSLAQDRLEKRASIEKEARESQDAAKDISDRNPDRSQRWQERTLY